MAPGGIALVARIWPCLSSSGCATKRNKNISFAVINNKVYLCDSLKGK